MSASRIGEAMLAIAARIGPLWYAIPSALVLLAGLATCSLIDEPDPDRFEVMTTLPHPSGTRAAVVARQRHADTGGLFACVWVVAPPFPSHGPSRRLGKDCLIVATQPEKPLALAWARSGRLSIDAPGDGNPLIPVAAGDTACYFAAPSRTRRICYVRDLVEPDGRR